LSWCPWGLSDALARFNGLSSEEAERQLYACCASSAWASRVVARRPFAEIDLLLQSADEEWLELGPPAWLQALEGHPRIGERGGHSPASSEREQRGVRTATEETLTAMAEENRRYEARFGHVFLISASGRSGDEILAAMRQRMNNSAEAEVRVAAEEHRKITRLRLERLLKR
jgi:OHCU decarboxylase